MDKALIKFNREHNRNNRILKIEGLEIEGSITYLWRFGLPISHDDDCGFLSAYGLSITKGENDTIELLWLSDVYYEVDDSFSMITSEQCLEELKTLFKHNPPVLEKSTNGVQRRLTPNLISGLLENLERKIKH